MNGKYRVGIVGCGKARGTEGATGYGMAHRHMDGYVETGKCELAAVADIKPENAAAFVEKYNADAQTFTDYKQMMEEVRPDIVSVCLWPHLHQEVVCDIAACKPKAIHCEKPMDIHWEGAVKMLESCRHNGVQLTINHQRRFAGPIGRAKELIDEGALGKLVYIEGAWQNLLDNGTHLLDMLFFFNGDVRAEWAIGQIEMRGGSRVFGALDAGQGVVVFRFANGLRATYFFGDECKDIGCMIRVIGDKGMLEILESPPWLRVLRFGNDWVEVDTGESIHEGVANTRAVIDLVNCLENGGVPLLSAEHAIQSTEVLFAAYESSRRRGRVDLPLDPAPSALLAMVDSGDLQVDE